MDENDLMLGQSATSSEACDSDENMPVELLAIVDALARAAARRYHETARKVTADRVGAVQDRDGNRGSR